MRNNLHSAGTRMKSRRALYYAAGVFAAALLIAFGLVYPVCAAVPVFARTGSCTVQEVRTELTDADADRSFHTCAKSTSAKVICSSNVRLSRTKYKYDGHSKKPSVTVTYGGKKLKKNRDYTVSYKSNKKRGTAKVIVRGKGGYKGTVTKTFKIS